MPRLSRTAVLLTGLIIGLGLWFVPGEFFGEPEPWDGNSPAYPLALLASGLLLGILGPGRPGAAVAGMFVGQLLVFVWRLMTTPGSGEFWLIGVLLLAGYTFVVTGAGALVGSFVRNRFSGDRNSDRRVSDRRA